MKTEHQHITKQPAYRVNYVITFHTGTPMSAESILAVPHLTTANQGPLQEIESHLLQHQSRIEAWFRQQWQQTPAPLYASVDLRNSGFKLAPVDTNLFPAGFNNLNPNFMPLCVQAIQSAMERICPQAVKLLIIPENHTRNLFYLESLSVLAATITLAGYEVKIGSLNPDLTEAQTFELPSGKSLLIEPIQRHGEQLQVGDYLPCAILLNNDLSGGRPDILENLDQMVFPPTELGWSDRLKSDHFTQYRQVANEFAQQIEIDPWLIDPLFNNCGAINFLKREGEECLVKKVGELLAAIQKKYDQYNIDQEPYVIIKADAGTYGMGIMSVKNIHEVHSLNRKQRNRMSASKEGKAITQVILQEGVYTDEYWGSNDAVAEPVVYMIDHFVVGGFYRVHNKRKRTENLNAPGMKFEPLAFANTCTTPDPSQAPDAEPNRFYAYGVIARLALLAAAREIATSQQSS